MTSRARTSFVARTKRTGAPVGAPVAESVERLKVLPPTSAARDLDPELADVVFEAVVVDAKKQLTARRNGDGRLVADREWRTVADASDQRSCEAPWQRCIGRIAPGLGPGGTSQVSGVAAELDLAGRIEV